MEEEIKKQIIDVINKIDRVDILEYIYVFIKNKFKVG